MTVSSMLVAKTVQSKSGTKHAYNFGRRIKSLDGLTLYEYICKIWTSDPEKFILNPTHQNPGLNTQAA